jgi:hypothetical protein
MVTVALSEESSEIDVSGMTSSGSGVGVLDCALSAASVAEERAGPAPLSTRSSPITIAVRAIPAAREWLLVFMNVYYLCRCPFTVYATAGLYRSDDSALFL